MRTLAFLDFLYSGAGSIPAWGPFLEGPEEVSLPESRSKISNFNMITELFYSHILNLNRGFIPYKKFQAYALLRF